MASRALGGQAARHPRWGAVALSAGFTLALVAFGAASAFVGSVLTDSDPGTTLFVVLVFLIVVPFLVYYAYPTLERRWYHYAAFEVCVLTGFLVPIPLVVLPWLIVSRRECRRG